jgi:gas vesicle protein
MNAKQQSGTKSNIKWVGLGLLTGATIAGTAVLLYTPHSGKGNRIIIRNRFIRAKNRIIYRAREAALAVDKKDIK